MLKKRLIPVMLLKDDRLVKTRNFDKIIDVGNPIKTAKTYSDSDADELIILNINRTSRSIETLLSLVKEVRKNCFLPISYGGGINKLEDVKKLISNGADKVVINSYSFYDYKLIEQIEKEFGSQSIIASIDVKKSDYRYLIYSDCGQKKQSISLTDHIKNCKNSGAGEIFVNSIDKDGSMGGFDKELIEILINQKIKFIYCGGVGNFKHLRELYSYKNINAIGCSSLFNFGDNNPIRAKQYLMNYFNNFKLIEKY